jgi:hypothetical protein
MKKLVAASLLFSLNVSSAPQSLVEYTTSAIHKLPVYYEDKDNSEKEVQLNAIAAAVAKVSRKAPLPPRQWAALLLTIGFHESTFSLRIHEGKCKPKECDHGLARGPWQNHHNMDNDKVWDKLVGIENVESQVWAADHLLRRVSMTCSNEAGITVSGILTAYAGRRCFQDWPGLNDRLNTFSRMRP